MESPEPKDRVAEKLSPYGEQDEWGNSIANLRVNLRLTHHERLLKAQTGARFILKYSGALKTLKRLIQEESDENAPR